MALTHNQKVILRQIRALHARRVPLNISAVTRSHPKLMERVYAVRPFWGWKRALEDAGLSYAKINTELRDYVDCKICGRDFGALAFHLSTHNISPQDYAREYPEAELYCEAGRAKLSHAHSGRFKRSVLAHWEPIWTPEYTLDRMAELHRRGVPLSFKWLAGHEKALTAHAIRHFGSWDEALRRIDLNPERIRLSKPIEKPTTRRFVAPVRTQRRARTSRAALRNREEVMRALRQRVRAGQSLGSYCVFQEDNRLYHAVRQHIGAFEEVYRLFEVWKPRESQWALAGKAAITAELRRRKAASKTLRSIAVRHDVERGHAFLNRATALFGSWTSALVAAGIEPSKTAKRTDLAAAGIHVPAWASADKAAILAKIRRRKQAGESLRWRDVRKERAGRALLERARILFGSWTAALHTLGLQPRFSYWPKAQPSDIVAELRRRQRAGETLRIEKIQSEKWGVAFFNRTTDLFGSWNAALIAAGIEPVRENSPWPGANRAAILAEIRRRHHAGQSLSTRVVQREKWGGAFNTRARVLFGSWTAAILATGVKPAKRQHGPWPVADRPAILREIRRRRRAGESLRSTEIATEQWGQALLRRVRVLFDSWEEALTASA